MQPHIDLETPVVWGDETAIRRILDNLLMNAVGISPPDSRVLLRVSAPESGWLEFAIQDQGPGIPVERYRRLFTPFDSLQFPTLDQQHPRAPSPTSTGMGLGLAIVKELTTALGGSVTVMNTTTGCTFIVRLRATGPAADRRSA